MITSTGSRAEVRLEPAVQSGFRPRTHGMGADSDDSQNIRIRGTVFTRLSEKIDTAFGQQ
jgi:hypothetical protein